MLGLTRLRKWTHKGHEIKGPRGGLWLRPLQEITSGMVGVGLFVFQFGRYFGLGMDDVISSDPELIYEMVSSVDVVLDKIDNGILGKS